MKRTFLLLAAATLLACPTLRADDSTTNSAPSGPPGGWHHGGPPLTPEEMQELKTDHDQVIQNNADLAAEEQKLKQEMDDFHKKMDAAMIAIDPNVAPIIAKLDAAHKHHDDDGGGPPPPPPSSN